MLNIGDAAKQVRRRIGRRLEVAENHEKGLPKSVAIAQRGASFRALLFEAMRRGGDERQVPSPAPDALFLAFPEKFLAKVSYLAFGAQREKKSSADPSLNLPEEWTAWGNISALTRITNFARTEPRAVLLAHGLSAIDDSVLLLADIGRASRAATALEVRLDVLLADVSWISHNRSLRRFDLSDDAIEDGLRLCQDRRQRLYSAIGARVKVHAIAPYPRRDAISGQKIQLIAARYLELASLLWGDDKVNRTVPLSNTDVAVIGRPLPAAVGSDSPLSFLAKFPGALQSLETAMVLHLNVIRTIAQRFRHLSLDTFSYYFAQYYAQDEYRGTHVKIAPISERDFDEPYDELDESFRSWGEGHDPAVGFRPSKQSRRRRMAAVYLPQYVIGDWDVLPYTPLSLSALARAGGQVAQVREHIILISDSSRACLPKIEALLRNTLLKSGAPQLNRVLADTLSFIQAVVRTRGRGMADSFCALASVNLDVALGAIDLILPRVCSVECEESANIGELWLAWLDSIEREVSLEYIPSHLLIGMLTAADWTDSRFLAAAEVVMVANRIASELSE